MMLFRRASKADLEQVYQLASQSGFGITTLPADKSLLQQRIDWSVNSFKKALQQPENEYYFFVLEDTDSRKIVGTSAIEAFTGHDVPFYSYKLTKRTRVCHSPDIRADYEVLNLVNDKQGCSELCTLFLNKQFRYGSNGLLLSKARFLFIAQFPLRFSPVIIAEMRGISDNSGSSPFWNAVGSHFFHMSFVDADKLTVSTNKQFIADLMPRNPIYVKLLEPSAQDVIGKPHKSTIPAMKILLQEGFRYSGYVDIFDAGPTVEAPQESIQTLSSSQIMKVKNLSDDVSSKRFIIANTKLDFRASISQAVINEQDGSCILSKATANLLQVKCGDSVRIAQLKPDNNPFSTKAVL